MVKHGHAVCYRWDELESDQPMALLSRKRVIGEKAMISRVVLKKGCVVPRHAHENEQFACIMSGALEFTIGDESQPRVVTARAGAVMYLPSDVPHAAEALEDTVVLDIFSPPSEKTGIDRR
ncbi:MAG: cupin domain-containing protein [Planctomycetes bacterium]|nr:cupin domain-containing protein [Planctomycetota bacterium]